MNRKQRVLLVGRRFWPLGGFDSSAHLVHLATGLSRRGVHVEVMTPRHASSWGTRFAFGSITVHRPAAAPRSDWSVGRYVRHCTAWLKDHAEAFDVILADSMREEAVSTVAASTATGVPAILCHSGSGAGGDAAWLKVGHGSARALAAAKAARRIVCDHPDAQRELLIAGIKSSALVRIDPGFGPGSSHSVERRAAARRALATANTDLAVPPTAPVAVCFAPLRRTQPMMRLVESVRFWVQRFPDLRVWFIGDGADREELYRELRADGVRVSIAMPGAFNNVEDLVAAADVFLQIDSSGLDFFLGQAVANELPIVAADVASVRERLAPFAGPASSHVQWFAADSAAKLRRCVRDVVQDLDAARAGAATLRRRALRHRTTDDWIGDYLGLIESTTLGEKNL